MNEELNVVFLTSQTNRAPQLLRQGQLGIAYVYGHLNESDINCQQLTSVRLCIVIPTALIPPEKELIWRTQVGEVDTLSRINYWASAVDIKTIVSKRDSLRHPPLNSRSDF